MFEPDIIKVTQQQILSIWIVAACAFWSWPAFAQDNSKQGTDHFKSTLKTLQGLQNGRLPPIKFRMKPMEMDGVVVDAWAALSGEKSTAGSSSDDKQNICYAIQDDKGNIFVAAKGRVPYNGCEDILAPLLGKRVHVKGMNSERGGNVTLKVTEVKPL